MLSLGKLMPPDPPEKWKAIKAALEDDAKTRRLTRLLVVSSIPVLLISIAVAAAVVVWAVHRR
jgi:hypothetical protein